jgi:putative aldouronate transport system substrate-binding protein
LKYIAIVLGLTAILATNGCVSKDDPQSTTPADPSKKDIVVSVYDRGSVPAEEGTIEKNRWTQWLNEKGPVNVSFEAIPRNDSQQKFSVLLASASAPDLMFEYSPTIKNTWYNQKQLLPLDDLIANHSVEYKRLMEQNPILKKAGLKSDGKLYEFVRLNMVYPNMGILIRADWLKKLGLEIPRTTEELYWVAKAFAERDPDGNGKKDTFGLTLSLHATTAIDQIFQNVDWYEKNGELHRTWDQAKAATAFKKRLVEEAIIDRDFLNDNNGAKAKQDWVTGKLGIYPNLLTINELANSMYPILKKNVPEAEMVFMPYPRSPFGQFNPTFANPVQATAVVNAKTKEPEGVMKYVDFLVKRENSLTLKFGIEDVHSKVDANGCRVVLDGDKFKNEVNYNVDFTLLYSSALEKKCGSELSLLDPVKQKDVIELWNQARDIYLDTSKPLPELTHSEHMPELPKEYQLIIANLNRQIGRNTSKRDGEYWVKAIFGKDKYSPDQAVADAIAVWEHADGKAIEMWMNKWYRENKEKAIMTKDIYEITEQQKKMLKP